MESRPIARPARRCSISSPSLATALNPIIGYARAAEIAKESAKSGTPIRSSCGRRRSSATRRWRGSSRGVPGRPGRPRRLGAPVVPVTLSRRSRVPVTLSRRSRVPVTLSRRSRGEGGWVERRSAAKSLKPTNRPGKRLFAALHRSRPVHHPRGSAGSE